MKKIPLLAFTLCLLLPIIAFAQQNNIIHGKITTTLQNRLLVGTSDLFQSNLGLKHGVIKGDVLRVVTDYDKGILNPIGDCVVTKVDLDTSVCEVARSKYEIMNRDKTYIEQLRISNPSYYPMMINIMNQISQKYLPEKQIKIYVHNIFDNGNNITELSNYFHYELSGLLAQKKKFILVKNNKNDNFKIYPDSYKRYKSTIKGFMDNNEIDTLLFGTYRIVNNNIVYTIIKIDNTYGEEIFTFNVPVRMNQDIEAANKIITKYDFVETNEYVRCDLSLKEDQYMIHRDEIRGIITRETGNNIFKRNEMKRFSFNIIGAVDLNINVNNKDISIKENKAVRMSLPKGIHTLNISYKNGYFHNTKDQIMHTSDKVISKNVVLDLRRPGNLIAEIHIAPKPTNKNTINLKVYKETGKDRVFLKTISKIETGRPVEYYTD